LQSQGFATLGFCFALQAEQTQQGVAVIETGSWIKELPVAITKRDLCTS